MSRVNCFVCSAALLYIAMEINWHYDPIRQRSWGDWNPFEAAGSLFALATNHVTYQLKVAAVSPSNSGSSCGASANTKFAMPLHRYTNLESRLWKIAAVCRLPCRHRIRAGVEPVAVASAFRPPRRPPPLAPPRFMRVLAQSLP